MYLYIWYVKPHFSSLAAKLHKMGKVLLQTIVLRSSQ